MRKSELQFLKDTRDMGRLFYEPSLSKNAQDGAAGVLGSIKEHVEGIYDPNNPVESALSFLGPGILWILGFRWIAVVYELASALGFDWTHFFTSIKEKLRPFVSGLAQGQQGDTSTIDAVVAGSANEAFKEVLDPNKLQDVVKKYTSVNNMLFIKKVAIRYQADSNFMHNIEKWMNGALGRRMRKGVLGFIVRLMSWVIAAVLISAGFAVAGGLAAKMLGVSKNKKQEDGTSTQTVLDNDEPQDSKKNKKDTSQVKLYLNNKADQTLFTTTYNDGSHVWLLNMNVRDIKNKLISWSQQLYPQLNDKSAFDASSQFNHILQMFQERNKTADQLEIMAVPPPFKSIKEIVDSFAADVAAHADSLDTSNYA
jgi:hypothetical protein